MHHDHRGRWCRHARTGIGYVRRRIKPVVDFHARPTTLRVALTPDVLGDLVVRPSVFVSSHIVIRLIAIRVRRSRS
jgi:hypothetical protein